MIKVDRSVGNRHMLGLLSVIGYVGTIFAANWAIERFGIVPVGFGLSAPAGVYFAGLAFTLRDTTQRILGRAWAITCILLGASLSAMVSTQFAVASGAAFLFSEFIDFAIYTPLSEKRWLTAVIASNTGGAIADSFLFLIIAFGSTEFLAGQVVGKMWVTSVVVALVVFSRYLWGFRQRSAPVSELE